VFHSRSALNRTAGLSRLLESVQTNREFVNEPFLVVEFRLQDFPVAVDCVKFPRKRVSSLRASVASSAVGLARPLNCASITRLHSSMCLLYFWIAVSANARAYCASFHTSLEFRRRARVSVSRP